MKKNTNLTSRRKWVLTGVMGFAGVALLTTGFATFIVGNMNNTAAEDIGVTVDTVQNNSVELSINLTDSKIILEETTSKGTSTDIVQSSDEPNAVALDIAGNITVKYGDSFFNKDTQNMSLVFSLKYLTGSENDPHTNNQKNLIKDAGNAITTYRTQKKTASSTAEGTLDSWTYIEAPAAIDLTNETPTEEGNLNVITLNAKTLSFQWGSFFDGESPVTYYNSLEFADKTTASDQITSELNAMYKAMNNNTLELTAEILVEDKA